MPHCMFLLPQQFLEQPAHVLVMRHLQARLATHSMHQPGSSALTNLMPWTAPGPNKGTLRLADPGFKVDQGRNQRPRTLTATGSSAASLLMSRRSCLTSPAVADRGVSAGLLVRAGLPQHPRTPSSGWLITTLVHAGGVVRSELP